MPHLRSTSTLPEQPQTGDAAVLPELLWHQRSVDLVGLLHRVRVPLIGSVSPEFAAGVGTLLAGWWTERHVLSTDVAVTSVVVDVAERDGISELVVLVTTDALATDHSIVGVRMIRDLRRAVGIQRLRVPTSALALAA